MSVCKTVPDENHEGEARLAVANSVQLRTQPAIDRTSHTDSSSSPVPLSPESDCVEEFQGSVSAQSHRGSAERMDIKSPDEKLKSCPESSLVKQDPPQQTTAQEKPAAQQRPRRDFAQIIARHSAEAAQQFCAALQRPDYQTTQLPISIPDKILVRHSPATGIHHVLVMGTVDFSMDPLPCPFAAQETPCRGFFATAPLFLKAHLQAKHDLPNVLLNFVCPCPAKRNAGQTCTEVCYDPGDMHVAAHLRRYHAKYYATMCAALEPADADEDPGLTQKRLNYRLRSRRIYFPVWAYTVGMLFPSQIIPDKIVIPTQIQKEEIQYLCNVDPCRNEAIGVGGPRPAFSLHVHMWTEHEKRFEADTTFFHECPECKALISASNEQLESHVKALHPQLLGLSADYSETAKQNLKKLEEQIAPDCIGGALTNGLQASDGGDGTAALFMRRYTCPVETCDTVFMGYKGSEREYMLWHVRAEHRDLWNAPAIEAAASPALPSSTLSAGSVAVHQGHVFPQ
ncbi:uncharacterized protein LOC129587357 isoform X2 [Paramacrobiotus metropolitanus]|uniref:uncharacterized protein LOC129587357 isoform X2 n=1 Tax=Paramacrobiotus metropolitanus TaxID=2943436 RepID=UPI0024462791|nr:uncharacterized protein LOC129587357 isoform X2 [Paramacrobiotus metropolitanus]